jgi:putative ABC transport system permease protein
MFAPGTVFLNATARQQLGGDTLQLQQGLQRHTVAVAGSVRASGAPLAVMDVAAAQELFGKLGQLSRIDLRLRAGVDRAAFMRSVQAAPDWPTNPTSAHPPRRGPTVYHSECNLTGPRGSRPSKNHPPDCIGSYNAVVSNHFLVV